MTVAGQGVQEGAKDHRTSDEQAQLIGTLKDVRVVMR